MITNWGSLSSRDQSKVPSDILLDLSGPKWGYKIPLDAEPLQWLKLHLLDRKNVPSEILASSYFTKTHRQLQDAALNPVDVVGQYLQCLWTHSIESIKRDLSADVVAKSHFRVIITLPAIWPQYAKERMEKAAERAGILSPRNGKLTKLQFISEPEAAALAYLQEHRAMKNLKVRRYSPV